MSTIDGETHLRVVGTLRRSQAGDRERLRGDRDEKERLNTDVEEWLGGQSGVLDNPWLALQRSGRRLGCCAVCTHCSGGRMDYCLATP